MTTQEFSNTFDTLLASYNTKAMFGDQSSAAEIVLDEYEKSVLLTQAQDMIIKQYFENSNIGVGFDGTERRQMDFSALTAVATENQITSLNPADEAKYEDSSINFALPTDLLIILNEKICLYDDDNKTTKQDTYVVVPINYREYDRELSKPWSQPYKKQAWRLVADRPETHDGKGTDDVQITGTGLRAEIVLTDAALAKCKPTGAKTPKYKLRYIRRPQPIILTDLDASGLQIDGINKVSECELNPVLHMDILNKAIELAYATRGGKAAQPSQNER